MISIKNALAQTTVSMVGIGLLVTGFICWTPADPEGHNNNLPPMCGIPFPAFGFLTSALGAIILMTQILCNAVSYFGWLKGEVMPLIPSSQNQASLFLTSPVINNSPENTGTNNTKLNSHVV